VPCEGTVWPDSLNRDSRLDAALWCVLAGRPANNSAQYKGQEPKITDETGEKSELLRFIFEYLLS
jgi:hypothetical protein